MSHKGTSGVNQKDCGDQIIRLAANASHDERCLHVHDAEHLRAIEANMKTVTLLIQRVTECGYLIAKVLRQKTFVGHHRLHSVHD